MQNLIYIKNLDYQVGNFQLKVDSLSWTVEGVTVLNGPSGSGKTTFSRILLGLEKGGSQFRWGIGDQEFTNLNPQKRNIGFTFQDYSLFPHLSCLDNIVFAAKAKNKTFEKVAIDNLINQFSLQTCQHTLAQNLSGGEQQRTALARALVTKPSFLILDEPFSALDSDRKQEAKIFVKDITNQLKIPTLLITHDPDDVVFFKAQKLLMLKNNQAYNIVNSNETIPS